ncbi:MAG: alpha-galactosidase [bacterium]|nr:alpha-galactosidase [bacterium]MDY4100395.1 alpha-galactosidase [Lachnospiraceae bacterium]
MAIRFEGNIFHLTTDHTLYQMGLDAFGVLYHLWYGEKTECSMCYLYHYPDVGFSGNPYEAGKLRTYSMDTLPLEYATLGNGDYRIPAAAAVHADGSCALDFRYESHKIYNGKYGIEGLPAVYADASQAQTLEIRLRDAASGLVAVLFYGVLEEMDVITRSVVFENDGEEDLTLTKAHSVCLQLLDGAWDWIHFHGRHTMERQMERTSLFHGIQQIGSTRGTSSHQQNPSLILCEQGCTETSGLCIGAALMYSGSFQAQIEVDQLGQARMVMGIHPEQFSWKLKKGERFSAPEVILSCSTQGLGKLSQQFHAVIRNHVCRGNYKLSSRPVLINNWEATYFDFNEEKIYSIAKQASELGIDLMVLDDGWFGKRDGDCSGLGDWTVNEQKLKGGLAPLVEKINALGMRFGLWFEPEMVSEDSDLYREHPDWALRIPGRKPVRSRYQLVLDLSREEVRDYLYESMRKLLRENHIEYVKWDMNRSICDWYNPALPPERQAELPHRYILGLYELLERLTTEFPDVLFEGCSGGGGRFDAGMLYYCPQIWCSDDTDAHERTFIQYGTSFFYPVSTVGSHVSAVPNHQTGRVTALETRGTVAMAGSFGYELDLNLLRDEEKETVAEQVKRYRKLQPLIYDGSYFRLSNPYRDGMAAWSFVSEDQSRVLVQGVIYRAEANVLQKRLRLRGLDPQAGYRVNGSKQSYTGSALMAGGLLLPKVAGDDVAFELYLERL